MPKVIAVTEAAERLGVHERTVRRWIREGRLKQYRVMGDKRRFVSVEEIEALREPQEVSRPPDPAETLPVLVAAVIPHPDSARQAVLMTERRYATERVWSWPAGRVEAGETPADAVLRELHEELVVHGARLVRHLGDVDTQADVSRYWGRRFRHGYRMHHFVVAIDSAEVDVVDHEELLRAEWLSLDQVRSAVATLPPELAEAAVTFARQATASPAEEGR